MVGSCHSIKIGIGFFTGLLGQWSFLERFAPPDAMSVKKRSPFPSQISSSTDFPQQVYLHLGEVCQLSCTKEIEILPALWIHRHL